MDKRHCAQPSEGDRQGNRLVEPVSEEGVLGGASQVFLNEVDPLVTSALELEVKRSGACSKDKTKYQGTPRLADSADQHPNWILNGRGPTRG